VRSYPDGVTDGDVIAALEAGWGLSIDRVTYVPRGGGSYHWVAQRDDGSQWFVTADDLITKKWLGSDTEEIFDGLRNAFDISAALRAAGCDFVVAPVSTTAGASLHRLSPRYSVAVFPFVDGVAGEFNERLGPREHLGVLRLLAELHGATPVVEHRAGRRGLALPGRADLEGALQEVRAPWTSGPLAEPARAALAANALEVRAWLEQFDDLTEQIARDQPQLVITHGEPHQGNFMRSEGALFLIDWDTVGLAPPERDLWMLDDGTDGALDAYTKATGRPPDPRGIALYRLTWTLADLAAFVGVLRLPHRRTKDTEKALAAFTSYLPN
jgi:spectinomycin phosphotransferase